MNEELKNAPSLRIQAEVGEKAYEYAIEIVKKGLSEEGLRTHMGRPCSRYYNEDTNRCLATLMNTFHAGAEFAYDLSEKNRLGASFLKNER